MDRQAVINNQRRLDILQCWTTALNLAALTLGIPVVVVLLQSLISA